MSTLIDKYYYHLPPESIAQFPLEIRSNSKLCQILLKKERTEISTKTFTDLTHSLPANSLLLMNDSRVVPARFYLESSKGQLIEFMPLGFDELFLRQTKTTEVNLKKANFRAYIRHKKLSTATTFILPDPNPYQVKAKVLELHTDGSRTVECTWIGQLSFFEILDLIGQTPIPPYLNRKATPEDKARYQTVFSKNQGSVAAPTASLHFDEKIFNQLRQAGHSLIHCTLHVGAGTFSPVKTTTLEEHPMHSEWIEFPRETISRIISALSNGHPIIAVGTTALRSLESLRFLPYFPDLLIPQFPWTTRSLPASNHSKIDVGAWQKELTNHPTKQNWSFSSKIMIAPGYGDFWAQGLITNFHQPKSTLLALVDAFSRGAWSEVYQFALKENYRFLSYGDSSIYLNQR